jgi:hypothetical protein
MTPAQFSTTNISNSIALYLAANFLAKGYLVYYHARDAVQINTTSTGWYRNWSQNKATYLAPGTFATAWAAAKGVVTFVEAFPAEPRYTQRLISDTSIGAAGEITLPAISIDVRPEGGQDNYELGTKLKWRHRHLILESYTRDLTEQVRFQDWFNLWFEQDTYLDIADHDAGTAAAIGQIDIVQPSVDAERFPQSTDATLYQVLLNALMMYVV